MTYDRFEELPVWQEAIRLAEAVDDFAIDAAKNLSFSKRDQIERASISGSNNIAEGFERGTTPDLIRFIYIAKGSAGEVRSMCHFFQNRPYLVEYRNRIQAVRSMAKSCCKQLGAWAVHLQQSPIKGVRHKM